MTGEPVFSIVLCTYNRAALLRDALSSMLGVDYPPERLELVLVDNASNDDTPEVVREFGEGAPFAVRYVREERRGLSAARNRGVREARGKYLFFTDDDQELDPLVLVEHQRVAEAYRVRVVQGAIELSFPQGRPEWLRGDLATVLGKTRDVAEGPANVDLFGGNMLFERRLFEELPAFREDLGKGTAGYGEDIEITRRLRAAGEPIAYAPGARIYHVIGPDRSTPAFFRKNSFEKGYSDGLIAPDGSLPLFVAQNALSCAAEASLAAAFFFLRNTHRSVLAQARAANRAGRIAALVRQRRRP